MYFSFPSDSVVRETWLRVLKLDTAKHRLVCSQHFTPRDYRELCDRQLLKKDAVPSINIPISETDIQSLTNDEQ